MSNRFRLSSILTALTVAVAISSAWAGEAPSVQGDAARVLRRAEGLIRQKHYQKAAVEFERASELAGGPCPECLLGVGRAYRDAGQIDAALQVSRMALALLSAPADRAQAYQQLGSLLALKGNVDAAQEAFRKAVELDGSLATVFSREAAAAAAASSGPLR
jgi:tetratricopeptide (TPR) repeat protein